MGKKITIEDLFRFRGQILLTEKMKGKGECSCCLCRPTRKGGHEWDGISPDHYDSVKVFVPMSRTKYTELRKAFTKSYQKKENYKRTLFIERQMRGICQGWSIVDGSRKDYYKAVESRNRRKTYAKDFRLYPLHRSVYDEFAKYIYTKFGEPQFCKKKEHIDGVNWGLSIKEERISRKYGVYTHKRTIGVQIYKTQFEFSVDHGLYLLGSNIKDKFRKINTKKFRKKPGKLV